MGDDVRILCDRETGLIEGNVCIWWNSLRMGLWKLWII